MEANKNKAVRKGSLPIKVYCLPKELAEIEASAKKTGVSVAGYLCDVGQGY